MILNKKMKILINPEKYKDSDLISFFLDLGVELSFSGNDQIEYDYIIDDFFPKNITSPRIYTSSIENESAYIDLLSIHDPNIQKMLHFKFFPTNSNDIMDEFSAENRTVMSIKIQDYLNVGYIVDKIVQQAYIHNIRYDNVRKFLNNVLGNFINKVPMVRDSSLFDILYTFDENVMVLKIEYNVANRDLSVIDKELLKMMVEESNFLNIDLYEKTNQMILTVAWFSKEDIKNTKNFFIQGIDTLESCHNNLSKIVSGISEDDVDFEGKRYLRQDIDKLSLARRLAFYIKNNLKYEEDIKIEELSIDSIDGLLNNYPNKKTLHYIDNDVRKLVLKLIQESPLNKGLSDFITKVSQVSLNSQMGAIKRIFLTKGLKDLEESLIVKGQPDDVNNVKHRVHEWAVHTENKEIIRNVTQKLRTNEIWELNKSDITSLIDQEIGKSQLTGSHIVAEDLVKIISSHIKAPIEDVRLIVQEVVDEAIASTMFGENSVEFCMEMLKVKQQELDKIISENEKLKSLALKTMTAYKEIQTKHGELKLIHTEKSDKENQDNKNLKIKNDMYEDKLKNMASKVAHLENQLKMKDSEFLVLKNTLQYRENVKEKKEDVKTSSSNEEKLIIRLKQEKKQAEDQQIALVNELKKTESKFSLLQNQVEEMKKRKIEVDVELSDKKRELQKLKNDNNTLLFKVSEFERKKMA